MLNTNRKTPWYGKLDTPTFSNTVVFDPELPEAPKGKLYLYNHDRGQVVQYVFDMVSPRLRELSSEEMADLEAVINSQWEGIKKEFIRANTLSSRAPASAPNGRPRSLDDYDNDSDDSVDEGDFGDFDMDD